MADSQNQINDDANPNGFEAAAAEKINNSSQQSSSTSVVNGATPSSSSSATPNPLGNLSSYTYGLSLYMVNTDITNQFIAGGGTMAGITGEARGVRVVAQSGGFSATDQTLTTLKTSNTSSSRIEYYIDDLNVTTFLPGGPQKASASTEIKFKINEPMGFTFLQDLTRAGFDLNAESSVNAPSMNGIQQHFIIGIKFYGYDENGNVITQVPPNPKGDNSTSERLPERYFLIRMTKVKFKLDGRMVTYQCEAVVMSESIANGQVYGVLKSSTTLNGSTVWDVLANTSNKTSLVSILNSATATEKDSGRVKIPTKYSIEFLDDGDNVVGKDSVIGKAKLVNDAIFDNTMAKTFTVSDSEKSTIAAQFKAVTIDGSKISIPQTNGQTLLTIIDNIITKSEYISAALNKISTTGVQPQNKPTVPEQLNWYSVNPVITAKGFDTQTNDWAYEIKLQIKPYSVSYLRSVTATRVSTYSGPSKNYDYWLTGTNSEIISYEQQYDNLFYVMTAASNLPPQEQPPKTGAPVHGTNATNGDSSGSMNKQAEFNKEVAAQMYSPGDQSIVKIRILGDPDYIMSSTGINYQPSLGKNNVGIDPLKGQVFIEIKFLMATDYGSNGLLNVSDNIQFYSDKDEVVKRLGIKGVVYKIYRVDSVFNKGTFTQTLTGVLVDQQLLSKGLNSGSSTQRDESNQSSQYAAGGAKLNSTAGAGRGGQGGPTASELSNASKNKIGTTSSSSLDTRRASILPIASTAGGSQALNSKNLLPLSPSKNNGLGSGSGSGSGLGSGLGVKNNGQQSKDVVGVNDDQIGVGRPRGGPINGSR